MELIVCAFAGSEKAEQAKKAIQRLDAELDSVKLGNIAVLKKNEKGKFSFHETDEAAAVKQGATIGLLSGAILSVLFGPLALAAGAAAGAAAGSLPFASMVDLGFPDPALKKLGNSLEAGSSALVLLLQPEEVDPIVDALEAQGGTLIQHTLPADVIQTLKMVDRDQQEASAE
jgi:uncharacterized membrane protein